MINELLHKLLVLSEDAKNQEWATDVVSMIRRDAQPLIHKREYDNLRNVLYGKFPETDLDKLFRGKEMQRAKDKLSKSTVYFLENIRLSLIDERTAAGLSITVNSLDPEKEIKKKKDKELLVNRKGIEAVLKEITDNSGMPPITVGNDDYAGNVDQFDETGYDEFDPSDLDAFFSSKWGLKSELNIQKFVNAISRVNQVTRHFPEWIDDILICLHVASRVFVDEVDGKISNEYLKPYDVKVFGLSLIHI